MIKRSIRLKELGVNIDKIYTPSIDYLNKSPNLNKNEIYHMTTDKDGNQFGIYGNKAKKEIFILGASQAETIYMKPSKRIHSLLEKECLVNGYDYEVKNLAVSGSQTLNIINQIINKLSNKEGSTLIIMMPSNDLGPLRYSDGYLNNHKYHATIIPANNLKIKQSLDLNLELYIKNLNLIRVICEELKLNLILSSICYTGEHKDLNKLNLVLKDYCDSHNVKLLDIFVDMHNKPDYFYDLMHLLPSGSQLYAKKIYEFIKPYLIRTNQKKLSIYYFKDLNILQGETIWSDVIDVNQSSLVKLILDFEHIDESKFPALYAIDYHCEPEDTPLNRSSNNDIGYYKYIGTDINKRIEIIYSIHIPKNCKKIRIGLKKWKGKGIRIYDAHISKLEITNI